MRFVNRAGVGDEVAITAVVREYRRCYPDEIIHVDTPRVADIFRHNPHLRGGSVERQPTVYLNQINRAHEIIGNIPTSYGIQAGITMHDTTPEIWLTRAEAETAQAEVRALAGDKPVVAIDVWAKWPSRRWAWANYRALAERLLEDGWAVIELGKTDYDDLGDVSKDRIPSTACYFDRTSLREAFALLAAADLYIGNDSGLFHAAAACGTPQVILFGPKPWYSRAYSNTYPVYAPMRCPPTCDVQCSYGAQHPCLSQITVDQVWAAVKKVRAIYRKVPAKIGA